jgi:hypothetical protein
MGGGSESGVSPAAPASFCGQKALAGFIEITELFLSASVVNHGADRHRYSEVLAILTVPVGPFPVPSPAGVKKAVVPELQQRIYVFGAFEGDIAAPATVAPAGSATRHELFAAEGHTSISALAAGDVDLSFVNEHAECTTP